MCDVLYAALYVRVSCFVVRGCAVSRRYIHVCNYDFWLILFSVVNVYLDHFKFCVVCIAGRRYVSCSECNVVSNECNAPTPCLVQPIGTHGGEIIYFWCVCFRGAWLLGYFPASFVTPLPNSEQINYHFSNHTYTQSTANPSSLQLHPHCHPRISGQTSPE